MSNFYVKSSAAGSATGADWTNAFTTLAAALAACAAGDTVYVSQAHAETQATAMTLTSPGTAAAPVRIICGNDAATPPTATATTATVTTTGASSISFNGYAYSYGVSYSAATGTSAASINFTSSSAWGWTIEAGTLALGSSSASNKIVVGSRNAGSNSHDQGLRLRNAVLSFASASQGVTVNAQLRWTATASAVAGTAPTTLFFPGTSDNGAAAEVRGVDLSAVTGSLVSIGSAVPCDVRFEDCKLGTGVALTTGSSQGPGSVKIDLVNCDSGNTNYRFQRHRYQGDVYSEATVVRSGGASDGTTPVSRRMVSTAAARFYAPLESEPVYFWSEATGSPVTAKVAVVTDGVTLTDADAWLEVEYLGTTGYPLASVARDRATDVLATAANQTTDASSTWTTTGLTSPVKQELSVTFTPQHKGVVRARVMLARASTTMYVDPLVRTS